MINKKKFRYKDLSLALTDACMIYWIGKYFYFYNLYDII